MSTTITWTKEKLKVFEKKMNEGVGDTFMFEGYEFLKIYAKYLVGYLNANLVDTYDDDYDEDPDRQISRDGSDSV